ncbi:hypothetical protein [Plesiocystis pacifica]|nr:hypothetical protein [Plesiocystis pacifica]
MRSAGPLALMLLTSLACASPDAPPPTDAPTDEADPQAQVRARLEAMLAANPEHGGVLYVFARSAAARGEHAEALAHLERLAAVPTWDYPLEASDFGALADTPEFQAIAAQLSARAPAVEHGAVAMELDRLDLLPEGVAWNPRTNELLVGSLYERAVYAADTRGQTRALVAPRTEGLLGVLGMEVDASRQQLWVVAVGAPFVPSLDEAEQGLGGVWGFSLDPADEGRFLGRALGPHPGLNDLTVLADGRVVATDSGAGALWVHTPGEDPSATGSFVELAAPGTFFGANGIVAGPEPGVVYVADFEGIHRVDTSGAVERLALPEGAGVATLGGIDGLARSGTTLVGVQNLFSPGRVWAIELDASGRALVRARILDDTHPRMGGPTTGAFVDATRFWYLANASLQFSPEGLREAGPDDRHVILEARIDPS